MAVSLRRGTPVGRRSPPGMQLVVYCSAVFVGVYATVPYAVRYLHLDNSGVSASLVSVPLTPTWGDNQTVAELWSSQGCEAIFESERPVHTQDTWMLLRRAYEKAVEGPTRSVVYMSPISTVNGFGVPIEARQAVGKGRGVYAAGRGATKGELVWAARYQSARFGDGASYRRFLGLLAVDVACDVLQWAYVQSEWNEDKDIDRVKRAKTSAEDANYERWDDYDPRALISVDLDEGSYMNSGGWEPGEEGNVGCDEEAAADYPNGCHGNLFALRDIAAGEELLCNYGDFAMAHGWEWFGL